MLKSTAPQALRRRLYAIAALLIAGAILAPVAVYVFGVNLIAPYEGDGGMLGFLGSVYGEALNGKAAAWGLILSPAAFVLTWWAVYRLIRAGRATPAPRR